MGLFIYPFSQSKGVDMAKKKSSVAPPTVIAITLPNEGGMPRTGTLLVQRGDLAKLTRFEYHGLAEVSDALKTALLALNALEKHPPQLSSGKAVESAEVFSETTSTEEAELAEAIEEKPEVVSNDGETSPAELPLVSSDPLRIDEQATDQITMF
jgi:hypothetical protein